jgi:putative nucleotidyltransferase with HDIG domain
MDGRGQEWRRRPVLSVAVRCAVVGLPAVAALGVAWVLSRALPHPVTIPGVVLWYAVMTAGMIASILVVERAARRLLPLATLLNVSLLFPDRAPRRFAVARRAGRPRDLRRRLEELRDSAPESSEVDRMQRILELTAALSVHDRHTRGHSERVRVFTDMLAEEMGLPREDRDRLRWASLLHDIGKLLVPAEILRKPATLSENEWELMRTHPSEGARIIEPLRGWLGPWANAVQEHHERWDGKGYPCGLAGEQISLGGRIVAVADSYEVMTASRPYRRALGVEAARRELVRCSGAQFDPAAVRAFLNISVGRLWRVVGLGTWLVQLPFLARLGWLTTSWGATAASTGAAVIIGVVPVVPVPASTPAPVVAAAANPRGLIATPTAPPGVQSSPVATPIPTPAPTPTPAPPPTVTVQSGGVTLLGAYSAQGSFSDANLGQDQFTATVNYGDGSGTEVLALSGSRFSLSHQYPLLGTFTITVTVTDQTEGLSGIATVKVTVI